MNDWGPVATAMPRWCHSNRGSRARHGSIYLIEFTVQQLEQHNAYTGYFEASDEYQLNQGRLQKYFLVDCYACCTQLTNDSKSEQQTSGTKTQSS